MDRPGDRQVPEDSGEQRKMEETGCEIICGAPTTLAVKGYMIDDDDDNRAIAVLCAVTLKKKLLLFYSYCKAP